MTNPTPLDGNADKRTARHTLRTVLQVLVALAGAIPATAAAFDVAAADVAKVMAVLGLAVVVVTAVQNALEQTGTLPTLLPNPLAVPQPEPSIGGDPARELHTGRDLRPGRLDDPPLDEVARPDAGLAPRHRGRPR